MGQLKALCDETQNNIGVSSCKVLPQQPNGIITTPANFSLTAAQAADPAVWQAALLAAKGVRIHLFPQAKTFENISEAAVYEETSLADISVRDGRYKFRMSFQENINLHKDLFSHKNFQGRAFILDDQKNVTGTSDDNGATMKGFTISLLNPEKLTFNDGSIASKTPVYLSLADNLELDQKGCMIDGSFTNSLIRLTTVNLVEVNPPIPLATGYRVSVQSALDGTSILGLVASDFVAATAAGVAQSISAAVDNGDGTYDLTGVGLVTGTITLVAASALSITGYESSGTAVVTIP